MNVDELTRLAFVWAEQDDDDSGFQIVTNK